MATSGFSSRFICALLILLCSFATTYLMASGLPWIRGPIEIVALAFVLGLHLVAQVILCFTSERDGRAHGTCLILVLVVSLCTTFMLDRYYHPESVALYTIVPALAAASKIVIRYMGVMLGTTHMFLFGLMLVNDDTLLSNSKTNPIRRALYFPMQFSGFNHIAPSHDYWLAVFKDVLKAAGVERASTFDVSSDLLPGQPVPSPGGPKPHASSINTATMPKEP